MIAYIVTANGKVSSEAYTTLEEAQDFIHNRTGVAENKRGIHGWAIIEENGTRYEIHDVIIKESK